MYLLFDNLADSNIQAGVVLLYTTLYHKIYLYMDLKWLVEKYH